MLLVQVIIQQSKQWYNGNIYSNDKNGIHAELTVLPVNNENVFCLYYSGENGDLCDYGYYFVNRMKCENTISENHLEDYYVCQQEIRSFSGLDLDSYETSPTPIINEIYDVYCPIGEHLPTCTNNNYYDTEEECIWAVNHIPTINGYTCTPGTITKPIYLKGIVEDNIIHDIETCIYYNNREFCIDSNYWDTDSETTITKLKNDMESTLGITVSCGGTTNDISCTFDQASCIINNENYCLCNIGPDYCKYENGIAKCGSEMSI